MVHHFLLQPDTFNDFYHLSKIEYNKPKNQQQEHFAFDLSQGIGIKEAYANSYKLSNNPYDNEKRSKELFNELEGYIESLKSENADKIYITQKESIDLLHTLEEFYKTDSIKALMAQEHFTEFEIRFDYEGTKCKSLLDFVTKDGMDIMDIKTSSKPFGEFINLNFNKYADQLAFYTIAIREKFGLEPQRYALIYINVEKRLVYCIDIHKKIIDSHEKMVDMQLKACIGAINEADQNLLEQKVRNYRMARE